MKAKARHLRDQTMTDLERRAVEHSEKLAKYKLRASQLSDELEKDDDLQFIYSPLSSAGINGELIYNQPIYCKAPACGF